MRRRVQCVELAKRPEGLCQQTIPINDYPLTAIDPNHRKMLEHGMEKFLCGEGTDFTPPAN